MNEKLKQKFREDMENEYPHKKGFQKMGDAWWDQVKSKQDLKDAKRYYKNTAKAIDIQNLRHTK